MMLTGRQARERLPSSSRTWSSGGRHLWPAGDTTPEHSHRQGHLVYAASGVLAVHTGDGASVVPANRVAWTPAGFMHYHRAHGRTDMRIVFLSASLARLLPRRPVVLLCSPLARELLLALTGARDDDGRFGDAHAGDAHAEPSRSRSYGPAAQARLRRVLVDELRDVELRSLQLPEPRDDRLQALARLFHQMPGTNASLAELGRTIGASPRTLSRLFHSELGMTFHEWRTQLRIYHALVLLAEGYDTTRTAYACGWANPSSFIAAFTSVMGTTPGRYRSAL